MKRRIVIELEADDSIDKVVTALYEVLMRYADFKEGFLLSQEIVPEKSSGELQIPAFVRGGVQDEKANR